MTSFFISFIILSAALDINQISIFCVALTRIGFYMSLLLTFGFYMWLLLTFGFYMWLFNTSSLATPDIYICWQEFLCGGVYHWSVDRVLFIEQSFERMLFHVCSALKGNVLSLLIYDLC